MDRNDSDPRHHFSDARGASWRVPVKNKQRARVRRVLRNAIVVITDRFSVVFGLIHQRREATDDDGRIYEQSVPVCTSTYEYTLQLVSARVKPCSNQKKSSLSRAKSNPTLKRIERSLVSFQRPSVSRSLSSVLHTYSSAVPCPRALSEICERQKASCGASQ